MYRMALILCLMCKARLLFVIIDTLIPTQTIQSTFYHVSFVLLSIVTLASIVYVLSYAYASFPHYGCLFVYCFIVTVVFFCFLFCSGNVIFTMPCMNAAALWAICGNKLYIGRGVDNALSSLSSHYWVHSYWCCNSAWNGWKQVLYWQHFRVLVVLILLLLLTP